MMQRKVRREGERETERQRRRVMDMEWVERWEEQRAGGRRQTNKKRERFISYKATKLSECAEMFDRRIGSISRLNRWSHCSCRLG